MTKQTLDILSYAQQSSILAGLRLLQNTIESGELCNHDLPHFTDVQIPSSEDIDELCEEIGLNELAITKTPKPKNKLSTLKGDGFVDYSLDGKTIATMQRGDSAGTNRSGSRRVTWYGKLSLNGMSRPYTPSGTKAEVNKAIVGRIKTHLAKKKD